MAGPETIHLRSLRYKAHCAFAWLMPGRSPRTGAMEFERGCEGLQGGGSLRGFRSWNAGDSAFCAQPTWVAGPGSLR